MPIGLFALGVLLPLGVAWYYGAANIPRSDDWSYLVSLFRWVDHGRLGFNDWVSMTLVGQLVITMPVALVFRDSIAAVHIFAALIGFVGLVALVRVGRRVLPAGRGAVLLAVTLAVGPLWAPLVSTYMTDVPALTAQLLSIACAARAFGHRVSIRWFAAAIGWAVVAVSIRQYEIVPLIALVLVAVWTTAQQREWRDLRAVAVIAAIAAVSVITLLAWWSSLPDSLSLAPQPPASGVIANLSVRAGGFLRLTALTLLPVIVAAGPVRIVRQAWSTSRALATTLGSLTTIAMVVTYIRVPDIPYVGNYVERRGVLANDVLIGHRGLVMPAPLFDVLVLIASVGAVVMMLAVVPTIVALGARVRAKRWSIDDPFGVLLALTIAGFIAVYAIAIATDLPIFDRYVLPLLPLIGLLLLRPWPRVRDASAPTLATPPTSRATGGFTIAAVVLLAVVGLMFSTDSASFDATRWRVAEAVTRHGFTANQINGGFEWVSYHRRRGPQLGSTPKESTRLHHLWLRGLCVDVVVAPQPVQLPDAIVRRTMHGLGHGPVTMIAVRNGRPCQR